MNCQYPPPEKSRKALKILRSARQHGLKFFPSLIRSLMISSHTSIWSLRCHPSRRESILSAILSSSDKLYIYRKYSTIFILFGLHRGNLYREKKTEERIPKGSKKIPWNNPRYFSLSQLVAESNRCFRRERAAS